MSTESIDRPRRSRQEPQRCLFGQNTEGKTLEVDGIMKVLNNYDDTEGGINCSVCGKLYKSKVCLTKHLWEHSVYWDLFEGSKNHERVLSIQAAIILCSGFHEMNRIASLVVTSPHEKKPKTPEKIPNDSDEKTESLTKSSSKRKTARKSDISCRKRIRLDSGSDSGISSSSDSENLLA